MFDEGVEAISGKDLSDEIPYDFEQLQICLKHSQEFLEILKRNFENEKKIN